MLQPGGGFDVSTCADWLGGLELDGMDYAIVSSFFTDNELELEDLKEIKTIKDLDGLIVSDDTKNKILTAVQHENAANSDEKEEKNGNGDDGGISDHDRANDLTQEPMTPTERTNTGAATRREKNSQGDNYHVNKRRFVGTTPPKNNNNTKSNNNNNRNGNRNRNEQKAPNQVPKLNMIGLNNMTNTCFMNSAIQV